MINTIENVVSTHESLIARYANISQEENWLQIPLNNDICTKKDATHRGLKLVFLLYGIWTVQMMARGTIPIIPARLKDFFATQSGGVYAVRT